MAIDIKKYVDVTSGLGARTPAVRRNLIANVFTRNDKVAHRGLVTFGDIDEVKDFFGSKSEEYRFAVKYFGHISKSVTRPAQLDFTAWNYPYPSEEWSEFHVTVVKDGYCYIRRGDSQTPRVARSLKDAMSVAGDYAIVNIKFEADVVRPLSTDEEWRDGLYVSPKQHVYVNLNGHKFVCYNHCFRNDGFLRLFDTEYVGCAWVVNPKSRTTGFIFDAAESSTIVNTGRLIIDGGWYGTATAKYIYEPSASSINNGSALEVRGGEVTINGGNFTNGWWFPSKAVDGVISQYKYSSYVVTATGYSSITVNGGVFYGLSLGLFGMECQDDKALAFSVLDIRGGRFYCGIPNTEETEKANEWHGFVSCGKNILVTAIPADAVPSSIAGATSFARVTGGHFAVNINSVKAAVMPSGSSVAKGLFRGRVSVERDGYFVHSATESVFSYNYEIPSPYYDFFEEEPLFERQELPVEALSRIDGQNDNFGSFCFLDGIVPEEVAAVSLWNASKNFKYLYSVSVTPDDCRELLTAGGARSGICYTLDKFAAHAEFIPMALFAATRYDRVNATKVFMYQQFNSEKVSVTTTAESRRYDAFDIDGLGSLVPVNYIGNTQQAGDKIAFYQDGVNGDGLDTACYCNEVWMKDAITVELLNAFLSLEKMPANNVGEAICRQAIATVVGEGINNGSVSVAKTFDNTQMTYIDTIADEEGAWQEVRNRGYWIGITIRPEKVSSGSSAQKTRMRYVCDYVLIYAKGDAIRKVEGSDILI